LAEPHQSGRPAWGEAGTNARQLKAGHAAHIQGKPKARTAAVRDERPWSSICL